MIDKTRYLYEVLVRGTFDGRLAGAHMIHAERVVDSDTGEVYADKAGAAEPLELAAVGGILGAALTETARQISDLTTAVEDRDTKLEEAERLMAAAKSEIERLTTLLGLSEASANALRDQLGAANAENAALRASVTTSTPSAD